MKREIIIGDNPGLRKKALALSSEEIKSSEIQSLIDDLFETMDQADGLGLAAPQIGQNVRLFIATISGKAECFINPQIVKNSKQTHTGEEGCLSFPGIFGKVNRFKQIEIDALDRQGNPVNRVLKDLDARVYQHELDHLEGILLPDRMQPIKAADKSDLPGPKL